MSLSNGVSTIDPSIEPPKYYGVLIVAPPNQPDQYYDLDSEVVRLGSGPESTIQLESDSLNGCEAIEGCFGFWFPQRKRVRSFVVRSRSLP